MTQEKVNSLIIQYKDIIPSDRVMLLKNYLEKADEKAYDYLYSVKTHNPNLVLTLSLFLGMFGIDRMVIGDVGIGICKLLFGFFTFGIWPLVDIFFCYKKAKEKNFNNLTSVL